MKKLIKSSSGLIYYTDFQTPIEYPLFLYATVSYLNSNIIMKNGHIDYFLPDEDILVFEIKNDYKPQSAQDFGGLSLVKGSSSKDFFEYYVEEETITIPFVRIVKNGNIYYGYASENGVIWEDKGYVIYHDVDKISIVVKGQTPYVLDYVKIYKKPTVRIYGLYNGWIVKVYDKNNSLFYQTKAQDEYVDIDFLFYPFEGTIEVYDENNMLVAKDYKTDIWGGDEYICAVDVQLMTIDRIVLPVETEQHLGNLENNEIAKQLIVKNNQNEEVTITIRIAEFSEFKDWANLAYDNNGTYGDLTNELTITLSPLGEQVFWLVIRRPPDLYFINFDFKKTECSFYLEIV